jgi:hypothetical protein
MYLLGNAQTLLGVLITLIVLCLYNNNSNFIRILFENIEKELTEYVRLHITARASSSFSAQAEVDNETEEAEFRKYDLYIKAMDLYHSKNQLEIFNKKKELEYIEFHLLLISVLVIVADLFLLRNLEAELFLLFLTFLSFIYTTRLWYRFCGSEMMKSKPFEYSYHLVMKHAVIIMAISIVSALCVGMGIRATALCDWSTIDHTSFGSIFTFYVMLYSVIVPLGLAYYIPRKYTRESLKKIDESIQEFSQD